MFYQESYKGYSPWGGIQCSDVIARGLKSVSTARHGGYMVTNTFANKYLSNACRRLGMKYRNYLCYEEDCVYNLVNYDLLKYNPSIFEKIRGDRPLEEIEFEIRKSLSLHYPKYLIEIGVEPVKEQYQIYLNNLERDKMIKENHPNCIVYAISVDEEVVKVLTVDNKYHYVTKESYRKASKNIFNFLSNCELVEDYVEGEVVNG